MGPMQEVTSGVVALLDAIATHASQPHMTWTPEEAMEAGRQDGLVQEMPRPGVMAWPGHYMDGWWLSQPNWKRPA